MKSFNILLPSVNAVKNFVNLANRQDFDIDLVSGRYIIDAKSIMGIFSLDLSKPIQLEIHADDKSCDAFKEELKPYLI